MQLRQARARTNWLTLPDDLAHLMQSGVEEFLGVERGAAGQQLVEKDPETVNIAPRIDVQSAHLGLLGTHVSGCADKLLERCKERLVGQAAFRGFSDAEINYFGHRNTIVKRDQDIRRFQVAVNDA